MRVSDVISTGAMDARLHGVHEYHRELVARLRGLLGDELIGVYAGGSFTLGGFDPYLSDLDVAAVAAAPVDQSTKLAIVEALPPRRLDCVPFHVTSTICCSEVKQIPSACVVSASV